MVIKNVQRFMEDSGKLEFCFHDEDDIIVVDDEEWRYAQQMKAIWTSLNLTTFRDIKRTSIVRNFVKLKV